MNLSFNPFAFAAVAAGVVIGLLVAAWAVAALVTLVAIAAVALRVRAVEGGTPRQTGPVGPLVLGLLGASAAVTGLIVAFGPTVGVAASIAILIAFFALGGEFS